MLYEKITMLHVFYGKKQGCLSGGGGGQGGSVSLVLKKLCVGEPRGGS